ncbi:DUF2817 domain-containing protein [Shewanella sp. AS16]|uniref:M14 family zinc carboxypeptidase n=1 Tax=Shewanella sp. AS16 TaxID=2907625 RepID=UPI001F2644C5|nr:M14 family zinc carboxypeptidase [Shewanella sp. AS16]MCE9688235.1 DUF2817 domain-containing protein [Shewanella sp. AS16]
MHRPPFELDTLSQLIAAHESVLRHRVLAEIPHLDRALPLYSVELGCQSPGCPTVLFVGGVHGVERIGSQVILALLTSLLHRLDWDRHLRQLLTGVRLAFVPVVNPVGILKGSRGNGNGVDLMRNAPIEASDRVTFMVGGQRVSPRLPWYRGHNGMELETAALVDYVKQLLAGSSSLMSLDAHSGFGLTDHIWFPFAGAHKPIPAVGHVYRLKRVFETSYPHHGHYGLAPQSRFYRTHGDIWDYLVTSHSGETPFVPFTLEMGSWAWIKKNPRQVFNFAGFFNPQKTHRHHRILRRHTVLMQFMMDLAYARALEGVPASELALATEEAIRLWYSGEPGPAAGT